jgi:hypothetical protein
MTTYKITAPDGKDYQIDGPAGATDEQVRAKVLEQHPEAVKAAASKPASFDLPEGLGEAALHYGSEAAALPVQSAASLYMLLTKPSGKKVQAANQATESVGKAMTYETRSSVGKALSTAVDFPGKKIGEFGTWLGDKVVEKTGSAGLGAAAAMAPAAAATLLGSRAPRFAAGRIASKEATLAKQQVARAPMDASKIEAHNAGFKIAPSEAGGALTQTSQTVAGGPKLEKEISSSNAARVQDLVKLDVGLDPDHEVLSDVTLERERQAAEQPYEMMRSLGVVKPHDEFYTELANVGSQFAKIDKAFPKEHDVASPDIDWSAIEAEKGRYFQPEFNADSALEAMKQLRRDAKTLLKARDDPKKLAMGLVKRQIAEVFLDEMDRHANDLGVPALKDRFVESRRKLAKINTLEDAMVGDVVSARSLAEMWDNGKGVKLDGNMLTVAKAATKYKKSFQEVKPDQWKGYLSAVDYFFGAGGLYLHNPYVMGALIARPLTRSALRSKYVQNKMTKTPSYKVGPITKSVRAAGEGKNAPAAAGLGMAGTISDAQNQ